MGGGKPRDRGKVGQHAGQQQARGSSGTSGGMQDNFALGAETTVELSTS
jgi:hypothetical protein